MDAPDREGRMPADIPRPAEGSAVKYEFGSGGGANSPPVFFELPLNCERRIYKKHERKPK